MRDGFVKVAAAVPLVQVADCFYNIEKIEGLMRQASEKGVQIIAFPELSVTGYTCLDLFAQQTLLDGAEAALLQLVSNTADLDILTIVGVATDGKPADQCRRCLPERSHTGCRPQDIFAQL